MQDESIPAVSWKKVKTKLNQSENQSNPSEPDLLTTIHWCLKSTVILDYKLVLKPFDASSFSDRCNHVVNHRSNEENDDDPARLP